MKTIQKKLKSISILMRPFWKYDKCFVIITILWQCIHTPMVSLLYILLQQTLVDQLFASESVSVLLSTLLIFAVAELFMYVFGSALYTFFLNPRKEKVITKINLEVFDNFKKTDYKYFDTPEFYDKFTVTYGNYANKSAEVVTTVGRFFGNFTAVGALLSYIITSNWWVLLITAIATVLKTLISRKNNKIEIERDDKTSKIKRILSYLRDTMVSRDTAMDLKCTGVGTILSEKYSKASDDLIETNLQINKKWAITDFFDSFLEVAQSLAIRVTTCLLVLTGSVGVGSVVSLISASNDLAYKVRNFTQYFDLFHKYELDGERITEFLELNSNIETTNNKTVSLDQPFSIEFRNVNFSYDNSAFALKNVNMKIKSGMKIAIVGENGGGKTTLTKLLMRLYDPNDGEILVNGHALTSYDPNEYRAHIGIAFQDVPVYSLTLRENLSVYKNVSDSVFNRICDKMPLLSKILKKNNATCDSEVTRQFDVDGIMLSGGEKQVVSIARIYAKEFGLLIFDEPVAALDPVAAEEMSNAILNKSNNATTIFVSHRLSNVVDADYIYVFKNGTVAEEGTHQDLMTKNGLYAEMFRLQSKKYIS